MQVLLNGLIIGSTYALLALGFSLIYSSVRFYHLLYGALALFGVYFTVVVRDSWGLHFALAPFVSAALVGGLGVLCWQYLYKPLVDRKSSDHVLLVVSFGALIVLQNLIAMIWGHSTEVFTFWNPQNAPLFVDAIPPRYQLAGLIITFNQLIQVLSAIFIIIVFDIFLRKTRYGMAIRAIGDNAKLTTILGIRTNMIICLVFFIGTFVSTFAGLLVSLENGMRPPYAMFFVLKAIIASFIGGVGSMRGALYGGLLLGIIENIGIYYFGSIWQETTAFVLLAAFLLFRPQGIVRAKVLTKG